MTFENQRCKPSAGLPGLETLIAWSKSVFVDPGLLPEKPPPTVRTAEALFKRLIRSTIHDDPARSELLLDELRALQRSSPMDAAAREALAVALLHRFTLATEQSQRAAAALFLDELRGLHRDCPEDAPVREALALGLVNASLDALAATDEADAVRLLEELLRMHGRWPADSRNSKVFSPLLDGWM